MLLGRAAYKRMCTAPHITTSLLVLPTCRLVQAGLTVMANRVCTEASSLAMTRALGDTK